jgi:hypothetical protein
LRWTAQQLRDAFPWDEAVRYLIHDRDHAFDGLGATAKAMGIEEVVTAPHAPWQNPFVERFVGSARRECFDHVIAFNEAGVRKLLGSVSYFQPVLLSLTSDAKQLHALPYCHALIVYSLKTPTYISRSLCHVDRAICKIRGQEAIIAEPRGNLIEGSDALGGKPKAFGCSPSIRWQPICLLSAGPRHSI